MYVLLVAAATGVSVAGATAPADVQVEYAGPGVLSGGSLRCALDGIVFPLPGEVAFEGTVGAARLVLREVRYDRHVVLPGHDLEAKTETRSAARVDDVVHALPAGALQVTSTAPERLVVQGLAPAVYTAEGEAGWGPPRAFTEGPYAWGDERPDAAASGSVLAPARMRVDVVGPHRVVGGDGTGGVAVLPAARLYLRAAHVTAADGTTFSTGDHETVRPVVGAPPAVQREEVVFREAWLVVEAATFRMPGEAQALCRSLDMEVHGTLVLYDATGRSGGADGLSFQRDVVTLEGRFTVRDQIADGRSARSVSSGEVRLAALDFAPTRTSGDVLVPAAAAFGVGLLLLYLLKGPLQVFLGLYSRIDGDALLAQPNRALLMDYVGANPGCNLVEAARDTGVSRSVLKYHLGFLERRGLVQRVPLDGEVLLLPTGSAARAEELLARKKEQLLFLVEQVHGGPVRRAALVAALRERFAISDAAARKWIGKGEALGLLERQGAGREVRFCRASG